MSRPMDQGLFHFVMIKPSRYDDDGYPLQWIRSAIPSNTLACVYALADDARRRAVLGTQVEIRLHAYDETNRRIRPERIIWQATQRPKTQSSAAILQTRRVQYLSFRM